MQSFMVNLHCILRKWIGNYMIMKSCGVIVS
uniref:Uncharacterized protein n=1 Tax=Setaria italica TaxID=4555 RepID=K4AN94_SETIT